MEKHDVFKINWIGFPKPKKKRGKIQGCYLIGGIYVGASTHIRERIMGHCRSVYSTTYNRFTYTARIYSDMSIKEKYIYNCILNDHPIDVEFIHEDVLKEKEMYIKYGIPINYNTTFYTEKLKNGNRKYNSKVK